MSQLPSYSYHYSMNRSQSRDNILNTTSIIPESLYVQQLKSKIQKLELCNSNYNELYNKHNSLLNQYNIIEKEKERIEDELHHQQEHCDKVFNDLCKEIEQLNNSLNEKEQENIKLFKANTTLFNTIDEKSKENEYLMKELSDKDNIIYNLNQEKKTMNKTISDLNEINENKHHENYKPDYNDLKIYAVLYRRYKVYTMIIQR